MNRSRKRFAGGAYHVTKVRAAIWAEIIGRKKKSVRGGCGGRERKGRERGRNLTLLAVVFVPVCLLLYM